MLIYQFPFVYFCKINKMILEIFVSILYVIAFIFLIKKLPFFKIEGLKSTFLIIVFLLKVIMGLVLFFIYTRYYPDRSQADIFKYFDDSKIMYDALFENPSDFFRMLFGINNDSPYFSNYYNQMNHWYRVYESNLYNDSHTIIRINAVFRIFSFGIFHVHSVFMCFISLAGLTALYKFFVKYLAYMKGPLFFSVYLIPSVLLWCSGVLKESVLIYAMGFFLYHVDLLRTKKFNLFNLMWLLFSLLLLIYTKYYVFAILVPLTVAFLWVKYSGIKRTELKYLIVFLFFMALLFILELASPGYNVAAIIAQKQNDIIGLAKELNAGSLMSDRLLKPEWWDIIKNIPLAFANAFFRPFIFESANIMMILASVENMIFLLLMVISIVFIRRKITDKSIFYFCLFFFHKFVCYLRINNTCSRCAGKV